jgi:hypothetical protein
LEEVKEVSAYNPGIPCYIYHWAGVRQLYWRIDEGTYGPACSTTSQV